MLAALITEPRNFSRVSRATYTAEPTQRTDDDTSSYPRRRANESGTMGDRRDGSYEREIVSGSYADRKPLFPFGLSAHGSSIRINEERLRKADK